jgi:hypothetical protein
MKDYLSSHNEDKDGDQDIVSPSDQLYDNVGTYYQDSSLLQEIVHSQTELV